MNTRKRRIFVNSQRLCYLTAFSVVVSHILARWKAFNVPKWESLFLFYLEISSIFPHRSVNSNKSKEPIPDNFRDLFYSTELNHERRSHMAREKDRCENTTKISGEVTLSFIRLINRRDGKQSMNLIAMSTPHSSLARLNQMWQFSH